MAQIAEPPQRGAPERRAEPASARRRVVFLADSAGEIIAQARLIREARLRGHELLCFAPQDPEAFRALWALGVEAMRLPGPKRDKHTLRELSLALSSLAPDVLAALSWPVARLGIAAAVRADVGRVVAAFPELALALSPAPGDGRLRRECARLLARCHAAIVPGVDRDPVLHGRSLLPPGLEPVFIAGQGVDLARTAHAPLAPLTKGMVFLAIAHPGSEAGIGLYCACAARLRERSGNAIYLTVSPPDATPSDELLRLMKAHRGRVRYLGPREDMDRLLARAHVVVFPDKAPYFPQELSQALAIGRPVISADVATRRLAVEQDINGLRVAPGDPEALAMAIQSVLRRPDLIPRYAKESRRIATTRFDIEGIVAAQLRALAL